MHLVKIRGGEFSAKLMSFRAEKRNAKADERGDQRLSDLVGIDRAVRVTRFDLAQCRGNNKQAVRKLAHAAEPRDENIPSGVKEWTMSERSLRSTTQASSMPAME